MKPQPTKDPAAPLTRYQAANFLHVSERTLQKWAKAGYGPLPIKLPTGRIIYRVADLLAFVDELARPTKANEDRRTAAWDEGGGP